MVFTVDDTTNIDRRWEIYRNDVDLFLQASGDTNDAQKKNEFCFIPVVSESNKSLPHLIVQVCHFLMLVSP